MRFLRLPPPLLVLGLAACTPPSAHLPAPDPSATRELVKVGGRTCSGMNCRTTVTIGERRLRVENTLETVSPDEALGRPTGSRAGRAMSAVGGALLRSTGFQTVSAEVRLGTRTVTDPAGLLALRCREVSINRHTRERNEENDRTEKLAQGIDCAGADAGDSANVRWRLRRGFSLERDSLAHVLDSLRAAAPEPFFDDREAALERIVGGAPQRYSLELRDVRAGMFSGTSHHWVVRRANGATVGTVHYYAFEGPVAIDIVSGADEEEASLLRLLAGFVAMGLGAG